MFKFEGLKYNSGFKLTDLTPTVTLKKDFPQISQFCFKLVTLVQRLFY